MVSLAQWLEEPPTDRMVVGSRLTKSVIGSRQEFLKGIRTKSASKCLAKLAPSNPQYLRKKDVKRKKIARKCHHESMVTCRY